MCALCLEILSFGLSWMYLPNLNSSRNQANTSRALITVVVIIIYYKLHTCIELQEGQPFISILPAIRVYIIADAYCRSSASSHVGKEAICGLKIFVS